MRISSRHYALRAKEILRESPRVRESVTGATLNFHRHRQASFEGLDAEAWRGWAEGVKSHLLTHLDRYLEEAERNLRDHGAEVHWAASAEDALDVLRRLRRRHMVQAVVKGKSMLSEELGVNEFLDKEGVDVVETDLGEYILQLLGEAPSHILGPAIHRDLRDIRELFHRVHGSELDASPEELAATARRALRERFLSADMGITGANFLVAETGSVVLVENEGNIRLSTSIPRVHVALVGIEKLLPRMSDLATFLQLLARSATGQAVGTFVSLIQGPGWSESPDAPEALHVILVDNGRSELLGDPEAWEILRCIRCSACLNVCPVYRQTGGHPYGWAYSGPLGAVLAPGLVGLDEAMPLPFVSTLCGACVDVCPVRIPIPDLLLLWRRRAVAQGLTPRAERLLVAGFSAVARQTLLFRLAGKVARWLPAALRDRALPVSRSWTEHRGGLPLSPRAFSSLWRRGI